MRGSESDEIVMIVKQIVVMQTEDARPLILGESKKAGNGNKETNFGNQELHAEEKRGDMFSSRIFICDVDEEEKEGKCGNERHDGGSATAICAIHVKSIDSEEEENEGRNDKSHEESGGKKSGCERGFPSETVRGDES